MTIRDFANATYKESHFYADGTSGDDANDGKTALTPKKTLEAVFALLPTVIRHNTSVHLTGVFQISGQIDLYRTIELGYLVIDGGAGLTVIDDNAGSNYTATASDPYYLTDSAASWTADAHAGYWVKVLTGPAANQIRRIIEHSVDTIQVSPKFTVDPTVGATYAIYRPSTEIQSQGANYCPVSVTTSGGELSISRLYFSGTNCYLIVNACKLARLRGLVSDSPCSAMNPFWIYGGMIVTVAASLLDPDTFVTDSTYQRTGLSSRHSSGRVRAESVTNTLQLFHTYCAGQLWIYDCSYSLGYGTRSRGKVTIRDGAPSLNWGLIDQNTAYSRFDAGILVERSSLPIVTNSGTNGMVQIRNSPTHGIELINSVLDVQLAIEGSGNTGAGVYARNNSQVLLKTGVTPTITGTVGDIAVLDPTEQDITWVQVAGGTTLQFVNKASVVKV